MKRIAQLLTIVLACIYISGCSSTRKAVQTTTDQHIQSSQKEDRHTENQTGEAVNLRHTVNDITNAVIEFTKTEYNDGTVDVDTTKRQGAEPTARPHDRESKKPPNGGVKSVTTGRITFNNDRAETTEADIKRDSETKTDECIESDLEEDTAAETKTEEKPKHNVWRTLAVCTLLNIVVFCLGCLYWRRKHK
ncbi:hypothetical protein ED551_01920 [Muribaculaceae bacterium Isolate-013 (NCI)]|nr:hypothetical protein ED551_01920 [Muribaculaceae bacterium Isolate-013 (NCI)]